MPCRGHRRRRARKKTSSIKGSKVYFLLRHILACLNPCYLLCVGDTLYVKETNWLIQVYFCSANYSPLWKVPTWYIFLSHTVGWRNLFPISQCYTLHTSWSRCLIQKGLYSFTLSRVRHRFDNVGTWCKDFHDSATDTYRPLVVLGTLSASIPLSASLPTTAGSGVNSPTVKVY